MRRLYALQDIGPHPDHYIRLNQAAKADILWWHLFTDKWNGISVLWDLGRKLPEIEVFSDGSGSWGCGAVCGDSWFQQEWDSRLQTLSIAIKEMISVVCAAAIFGHNWSGNLM